MSEGGFDKTRWTLVNNFKTADEKTRKRALEELCQIYWCPLYAWLRRSGKSREDASDLVQGFFAHILGHDYLERADPGRGKLRTWLLTLLRSYANDVYKHGSAEKRGGMAQFTWIDAQEGEFTLVGATEGDPESRFDRDWAQAVYDRALGRLEARYQRSEAHVAQFSRLSPLLGEDSDQRLQKVAIELNMTHGAVRVALHRMRQRFRGLLREEVADTILPEDDLDQEIRYLAQVLVP
ncbi:MAG: sigma factor [Verrucomicrobiota bacterium]